MTERVRKNPTEQRVTRFSRNPAAVLPRKSQELLWGSMIHAGLEWWGFESSSSAIDSADDNHRPQKFILLKFPSPIESV
jgi:hypothetical protein